MCEDVQPEDARVEVSPKVTRKEGTEELSSAALLKRVVVEVTVARFDELASVDVKTIAEVEELKNETYGTAADGVYA